MDNDELDVMLTQAMSELETRQKERLTAFLMGEYGRSIDFFALPAEQDLVNMFALCRYVLIKKKPRTFWDFFR